MIIGDNKPFEEIIEMIKGKTRVLIIACRGCVTICNVGGEKEAGILATMIDIYYKKNNIKIDNIDIYTLERQCDPEYIEELTVDKIKNYDCIISLACGVGVQFMSQNFYNISVYPGINTTFIGGAVEHGVWAEYCQSCGNCIIHNFGGLCPITRCSKSLMNGPCGGSSNGKCEIDKNIDCVWHMIIERMTKMGRVNELSKIWPIKNWTTSRDGGPRKRIREDLKQ